MTASKMFFLAMSIGVATAQEGLWCQDPSDNDLVCNTFSVTLLAAVEKANQLCDDSKSHERKDEYLDAATSLATQLTRSSQGYTQDDKNALKVANGLASHLFESMRKGHCLGEATAENNGQLLMETLAVLRQESASVLSTMVLPKVQFSKANRIQGFAQPPCTECNLGDISPNEDTCDLNTIDNCDKDWFQMGNYCRRSCYENGTPNKKDANCCEPKASAVDCEYLAEKWETEFCTVFDSKIPGKCTYNKACESLAKEIRAGCKQNCVEQRNSLSEQDQVQSLK